MEKCLLKARVLQLLNPGEFRAWLKEKDEAGKPLCQGEHHRSATHPLSTYLKEKLPPGYKVETKNTAVLLWQKGSDKPVKVYYGRNGTRWAQWFVMDLWQRHRNKMPTARMCLSLLRYKD